MSKKTLESLKAAFSKPETTTSNANSDSYQFWNMPDGKSAVVRFLPDANDNNPLAFLVEKKMHRLDINGQRRSVPCLKMYDPKADCPICALSAQYYSSGDKENGKKYYRNLQHVARAVIVSDPLEYGEGEENCEGKIKNLSISYQIHECIKDAFESGDLDAIPFDYEDGYDFAIKKKMVGSGQSAYASYTQSKFVRRSTPISDYIKEDDIELIDLKTLLPENPGFDKINEYLEAHLNGGDISNTPSTSSRDDKAAKLDALKSKMNKAKSDDVDEDVPDVSPSTSNKKDVDMEAEADAILAEIMNK